MFIIVIGLGGIGRTLVATAISHGNSVAVIDRSEERCTEILEDYDVLAITGNSTEHEILTEAGIERADALVATTSDDAVNLMTCWLSKRFKVPQVVSIVNQKHHSAMFTEVGVQISENPDELVADRLYFWAANPEIQEMIKVRGGIIFEIEAEEGAAFIDHEIREMKVCDYVFIALTRSDGTLIIPSGDVRIQPGDLITVFTKSEAEKTCMQTLNSQLKANPKKKMKLQDKMRK